MWEQSHYYNLMWPPLLIYAALHHTLQCGISGHTQMSVIICLASNIARWLITCSYLTCEYDDKSGWLSYVPLCTVCCKVAHTVVKCLVTHSSKWPSHGLVEAKLTCKWLHELNTCHVTFLCWTISHLNSHVCIQCSSSISDQCLWRHKVTTTANTKAISTCPAHISALHLSTGTNRWSAVNSMSYWYLNSLHLQLSFHNGQLVNNRLCNPSRSYCFLRSRRWEI